MADLSSFGATLLEPKEDIQGVGSGLDTCCYRQDLDGCLTGPRSVLERTASHSLVIDFPVDLTPLLDRLVYKSPLADILEPVLFITITSLGTQQLANWKLQTVRRVRC